MPLTHVCMWKDNRWQRITSEEAARLVPNETVSADAGLFMCEICGQFVGFTKKTIRKRHFRHSSEEQDKTCEDRAKYYGGSSFRKHEYGLYDLPLRIRLGRNNFMDLEIGFPHLPETQLLKDLEIRILARPAGRSPSIFSYVMKERMNAKGILYLSAGHEPCEEYEIGARNIRTDRKYEYEYWPEKVQGVNPEGTLFLAGSGIKLEDDSDVRVGDSYYLLTVRNLHPVTGVSVSRLRDGKIAGRNWYVYEVRAFNSSRTAADFFMRFHCRLTDRQVSFHPVWPVYVEDPEDPDIIKVDTGRRYALLRVEGDLQKYTLHMFPEPPAMQPVQRMPCGTEKGSRILDIPCSSRQMILVRRSGFEKNDLQHLYIRREPLDQKAEMPAVEVTDLQGRALEPGVSAVLPQKGSLRITLPYDGELVVRKNSRVIEKRAIAAGKRTVADHIGWDYRIQIYLGLDCVWETSYQRRESRTGEGEDEFLHRLQTLKGRRIPVPHSAGNMAACLKGYPGIQKWLYRRMQDGWICENSFRELQAFVLNRGIPSGSAGDTQ